MSSRRSCWVSRGETVVSKAWGHVSVRDESLEDHGTPLQHEYIARD